MKPFATALILSILTAFVSAIPASASTDLLWADHLRTAREATQRAMFEIERATDCHGLGEILKLGAGSPGDNTPPSDGLGELKTSILDLEVAGATVQFQAGNSTDANARDAVTQIEGMKVKVREGLISRLRYCGNGIEKQITTQPKY